MDNCLDCSKKDMEIAMLKREIEQIKNVETKPWKGKDKPIIEKVNNLEWKVVTHVRAGKDEEPKEMVKLIPHNYVKIMWYCIKQVTNNEKKQTDYHQLSGELQKFYLRYNIDLTEGNEKKLRNMGKHYFDKYLYPLYILEHLGYIRYSKNVYRLKE